MSVFLVCVLDFDLMSPIDFWVEEQWNVKYWPRRKRGASRPAQNPLLGCLGQFLQLGLAFLFWSDTTGTVMSLQLLLLPPLLVSALFLAFLDQYRPQPHFCPWSSGQACVRGICSSTFPTRFMNSSGIVGSQVIHEFRSYDGLLSQHSFFMMQCTPMTIISKNKLPILFLEDNILPTQIIQWKDTQYTLNQIHEFLLPNL